MKKAAQISDNEKWQAVVNCDKSYDGIFIYGLTLPTDESGGFLGD